MIDRGYLIERRNEYHEAWIRSLAETAAQHGAMQAIDNLLADLDAEEQAAAEKANVEEPPAAADESASWANATAPERIDPVA